MSTKQTAASSQNPATRVAPQGSATSRTQANNAAFEDEQYDAGTRRKSGVGFKAPSVAPSDSISRVKSRSTEYASSPAERVEATKPARTGPGYSVRGSQAGSYSRAGGTAGWGSASGTGAALTENNLEAYNEKRTEVETHGSTVRRNTQNNARPYNPTIAQSQRGAETTRTYRYEKDVEEDGQDGKSGTTARKTSRNYSRANVDADGYGENNEGDYENYTTKRRSSRRYSTRSEQAEAAVRRRSNSIHEQAIAERSTAIPSEAASSSQQMQSRNATRRATVGGTRAPTSNYSRRQSTKSHATNAAPAADAAAGAAAATAARSSSTSSSSASGESPRGTKAQSYAQTTQRRTSEAYTQQQQQPRSIAGSQTVARSTRAPSQSNALQSVARATGAPTQAVGASSASGTSKPSSPTGPDGAGWVRKTQIRTAVYPDGREMRERFVRVTRASA